MDCPVFSFDIEIYINVVVSSQLPNVETTFFNLSFHFEIVIISVNFLFYLEIVVFFQHLTTHRGILVSKLIGKYRSINFYDYMKNIISETNQIR